MHSISIDFNKYDISKIRTLLQSAGQTKDRYFRDVVSVCHSVID